MGDTIYQGGMKALITGLLVSGCDLRLMLVAEDFSGDGAEEDAVNLDDFTTIDEFGGAGYIEISAASVTVAYDATADEYRIDLDAGEFNASGGTVAVGPRDAIGILVKLHIDGTDANDLAIGFTTSGGFPINGVNTAIVYTPHADGLMFLRAV